MKRTTWFIFFLFLAVSCLDDPDCYQLNNNLVGITFRVMGSSKVDTVAILGVDIQGSDSIFVGGVLATGIPLPLNYTRDESDITFRFFGGAVYAMKLGYQSRTQFVSEDCGSRYELSDLSLLAYDFDSARVVDTSPGKTASSNIEVFRCPVPNIVAMSFRDLYISGTTGTSKFASVPLLRISADAEEFYQNTRPTTVYLPVDITKKQTSFVFHYQNGESKEITLNYRTTTEQRYTYCNTQTFIDSLVISDSYTIDSASFVLDSDGDPKNVLLDPHETNIYLYQCPQTNLAKINFRTQVSSTSSRTDTVSLKNVSADFAGVIYSNISATSITVPVNPDATTTTFTLEYADKTETVTLNYDRNTVTLFDRCGPQTLFSNLIENVDIENVTILATDSLQYPPVSNIEIYHN